MKHHYQTEKKILRQQNNKTKIKTKNKMDTTM